MTPNRRVERLRRTLCLARNNLNDQANVEREHLIAVPRPFEDRQASIRAVADRVEPGLPLSKVASTEVLKDVEEATSPQEKIGLLAAWQVCSAFAHGRLWAGLSFQDREEVSETDSGDLLLRTTGSTQALAWATLTAVGATTYGVGRYQRAAADLLRATPRPGRFDGWAGFRAVFDTIDRPVAAAERSTPSASSPRGCRKGSCGC